MITAAHREYKSPIWNYIRSLWGVLRMVAVGKHEKGPAVCTLIIDLKNCWADVRGGGGVEMTGLTPSTLVDLFEQARMVNM
jgi:hypothetical protein